MNADGNMSGQTLVVGEFHDPDQAREAMLRLERAGVDADAIHLMGPSAIPEQQIERSGELDAAEDTAKRAGGGAVVGAVIGAIVGGLLGLLSGVDPQSIGVAAGAIGGSIPGFLLGGFWAGSSRLAANPEALDTYTMDSSSRQTVRVQVRAATQDQAQLSADVLRKADASVVDLRDH